MNLYDENQNNEEETVAEITFDQYSEYKKSCEALILQAEQAAKLSKNPEFIDIVMGSYFEREPIRLAGLMAGGRLTEKQFQDCADDLRSIGSLRSFLQEFIQKGNIARDELANLEEAWDAAKERDGV